MLTRRAALMGAALVAASPYVLKTSVSAEEVMDTSDAAKVDLSAMTRRKVKLVAPPFVHAHEQVATVSPQIV